MSEAESNTEIVVSSASTGNPLKRAITYLSRVFHIQPFKRTLIYLGKRPMTEMYHPLLDDTKSELTITPAFRGFLALNMENCVGCQACAKVCPNEARVIIGKLMTVEEVFQVVRQDTLFYRNSSGGVTASGGEPMHQPEFLKALFIRCQEAGIHSTLDTCGLVDRNTLEDILEHVDLVLIEIQRNLVD